MNTSQQVALVTGASSGIGKATALALISAGYTTYATARRPETLTDLAAAGCRILRLDVTDDASMVEAVRTAEAEHGAIDVLVNNAGYGEMGPIEEVSHERWLRQFETNVFGPVRLAQLALPAMRAQQSGRIIITGSMGGLFTFPFAGAYHASKYAIESITDALRFEVAPFGIQVILIEPAAVRTPLAQATLAMLTPQATSPYADAMGAYARTAAAALEQGTGMEEPEQIATVILSAIQAEKPATRYMIGATAEQMVGARRSLADLDWDAMLRQQYGIA